MYFYTSTNTPAHLFSMTAQLIPYSDMTFFPSTVLSAIWQGSAKALPSFGVEAILEPEPKLHRRGGAQRSSFLQLFTRPTDQIPEAPLKFRNIIMRKMPQHLPLYSRISYLSPWSGQHATKRTSDGW